MTLSIQHLAFERNNELLFSEINESIAPQEILLLRGANGSGKSTLLRILAGYIQPEVGSVFWQGKNIFQHLDDYTQEISYLGHQHGVKLQLTVYENLELSAALLGKKIQRDELNTLLLNMNLEHVGNLQAIHLSAGQKRRLALTRLQLAQKPCWILDEPLTALDSEGQILLTTLLNQHLSQGGMAIVATHHDLDIQNKKMLYLSDESTHV